MSDYTISVNWSGKDALADSDAAKVISGSDFNTEFTTVRTAVNSKADLNGDSSEDFAIDNGTVAGTFTLGGTAVTSTAAELNILDGVTSTAAELNILDGVTSTAAELNILDGVTSTAAELNILDGVTSTAAELNILDGVTSTATELNYVDGVTSAIQTQINTKSPTASPTFTGTPAAPTQSAGNNTTRIATTAFVTTAVSNATITAAEVNALAYPIGSIYTAIVSTNPNTLLGVGTWSAFGSGKVLVGLDSGDGDFNSSEETGGAKTVDAGTSGSTTLSTSQMPAHTHNMQQVYNSGSGAAGGVQFWNTDNLAQDQSPVTLSTGGGSGHTHTTPSHSFVQPYIVVYFWKRTA